ncbi:amino acid aminotransferase [Sutterella sp.]|uniref:amino acid aminotransferase n=1 Tax=Sutterella sp. TaxID=1981025 RepID=UPI0026E0C75E|nr:amino acid aminotransferase [Sutterella sp.]MDO5532356.1 amino acid aminotransferase [Sutterella sp.]
MLKSDFAALAPMPDDPILGLVDLYKKDPRDSKVNLGVGVYLNEEGKLPLMSCVEEAERRIAARREPRNYMPMSGLPQYCASIQKLVFGAENPAVLSGRIATIQTLGGTGALQLGAAFAHQFLGVNQGVVSDPTWGNHIAILKADGLEVGKYAYINEARNAINFEGFKAALKALAPKTLVLLHGCCHNPTGVDLSREQWEEAADIIQERDLLPLVDMAYQGFGQGIEEDAYAIRMFADRGMTFLAASSCSKNFGLYGERVGALHVICENAQIAATVTSILKRIVRQEYSNPPCHGGKIVAEVLADAELQKAWREEVDVMRARILDMRQSLFEAGKAEGQDFSFAVEQKGMFSFTGLAPEEMDALREEYGVYGVRNSRICIAGLNSKNVAYVARSIAAILKKRA